MQKIIGLNIGSYSIKAVEIVNTLKSYEITNFYEVVIPYSADVEPDILIPQTMEKLFLENDLHADRVLTAMPGQYISSRIIPLPFSDPRKVDMAVISEVEDAVPFNLDDMIVDHQILGTVGDKTLAMVVMTRKNFLKGFLEHLQRVKIDPKVVDVDSLSFYNLAPYLRLDPLDCVAMVDIGHEKTSMCIVQNGVLKMFRSINMGGAFLTEFLARDLETTVYEAQEVKHRVSRLICETDPGADLKHDDRIIAERMTLATNAIVKELGRTLYAYKTWDKGKISKILLSGGTSKIRNMDAYLAEQLSMEVYINRLDQSDLKIDTILQEKLLVMPQSVAIGMRAVVGGRKHSQINLRKGEFAYVQNYEQLARGGKIVAKILGIALVLLVVSYAFRSILYNKQIANLEKEYQKEFSGMQGALKKKPAPNTAFAKLRADVKTQLTKDIGSKRDAVQQFLSATSTSPALLALSDLSSGIPKTVKIDIVQFAFTQLPSTSNGKLVIKGETDGYSSVESIKESIKKIKTITDLEEKQSGGKPGSDNKIIEFTFNAIYKPETGAQAKL
ncbi:MAG: pilus assembly protein PilM [Proteobacteria bacterium]|nr:pilus assembly protein PilM [Pseudomonadota bacterium]